MFGKEKNVGNDIYGVKGSSRLERQFDDAAETGFRHSDYFHKYFHGYTEIRIPKDNGGFRIERYYTDDYYMQDVTDRRWVASKVLEVLLAVISSLFYYWCMSRPGLEGNCSRIVAIPGFIAVVFQILMIASAIGYASAKRKMTWWEKYSSSSRLERYPLITAALLLLAALLILLNMIGGVENPLGEVLLALGVALSACGPIAMYLIEKKIPYRTIRNDTVLPEGEAHLIL